MIKNPLTQELKDQWVAALRRVNTSKIETFLE